MTYAVACRTFQQHRIFDPSLFRGRFEDDVFNPILHSHRLPAKTQHCRCKEQIVVLSIHIERRSDLIQLLHPHKLTWFQIQRRLSGNIFILTSDKPPRVEFEDVGNLVVERDEKALNPMNQ